MAAIKHLYVLRHGEARPGIGHLGDIKRPLTEKGQNHIEKLSKNLASREVSFDLVLMSPSIRTSQTGEIISKYVFSKEIIVEDDIYEAETMALLSLLNKINGPVENLLLIGHNPSLSALILYLTGNGSVNLHPGMLAIVEVIVEDWNLLGKNTGILKEIIL